MKKKTIALIIVGVLLMSATFTVALASNRDCKKAGCPPGHRYIDCVNCCYQIGREIFCFR